MVPISRKRHPLSPNFPAKGERVLLCREIATSLKSPESSSRFVHYHRWTHGLRVTRPDGSEFIAFWTAVCGDCAQNSVDDDWEPRVYADIFLTEDAYGALGLEA